MLLFTAAPGARGLLPIQPPLHQPADPMHFSNTCLCSQDTLLSPVETEDLVTPYSDVSTRKRLGKSSFLYKQKQTNTNGGEGTKTAVASAKDLRQLAEQHYGKTIGSSQYKKAWTRWLYLAVESIREDLGTFLLQDESNNPNGGEEEDVTAAFEKLFFDLGVAADVGTMPSFESAAARKGYALELFCRGRALAEFLLETPLSARKDSENDTEDRHVDDDEREIYPGFWTRALRSPECSILTASPSESCQPIAQSSHPFNYEIVSLGGGPGFDFVGVAMAAAFSFHTSSGTAGASAPKCDIHVTAMDYEEGWSDLVSAMDQSTRNLLTPSIDDESHSTWNLPAMSCDWGGRCDITKSILDEPVNANCKRLLLGDGDHQSASKLWICQYCVAENAKALRESDYVFFKELFREMPKGTLVLLTEVVPRLWPEMVRMLDKEGILPWVDVGFRKGYCGKQFLLKKRVTRRPANDEAQGPFDSLDARTRDQLEHFERLASYHERKVDSGWKRQGRKANGSTYHEEQLARRRN